MDQTYFQYAAALKNLGLTKLKQMFTSLYPMEVVVPDIMPKGVYAEIKGDLLSQHNLALTAQAAQLHCDLQPGIVPCALCQYSGQTLRSPALQAAVHCATTLSCPCCCRRGVSSSRCAVARVVTVVPLRTADLLLPCRCSSGAPRCGCAPR